MTTHFRRTFVACAAATLFALAPALSRAQGQNEAEAVMKRMLEATKSRAFDDFLSECDDNFKASLTKQMFEGVSGMLAPRLKQGWKHIYLGKLRQQGATVYLWRLEFADGKDEHLLKLALKDGKVSGILVQ